MLAVTLVVLLVPPGRVTLVVLALPVLLRRRRVAGDRARRPAPRVGGGLPAVVPAVVLDVLGLRLRQNCGLVVTLVLLPVLAVPRRLAVVRLLLVLVLVVVAVVAQRPPVGPRLAVLVTRDGRGARRQRKAEQAHRDSRGGKNGRRRFLHLSPS